ncbi:MAG: hypothetical protein NTW78_03875 [Campylobacterales bacterium]|nr:hypothetical protein [Campylobacterales bacterium]
MEKCRNFEICKKIAGEMDTIKRTDTEQTVSLKSMHHRLDSLDNGFITMNTTLTSHMTWEELFQKIMMWGLAAVAPSALGYLIWAYNAHTDTMVMFKEQSKNIEASNTQIENITAIIKEEQTTQKQTNAEMFQFIYESKGREKK